MLKKILIYQDYVGGNNNAHNMIAFQKAHPTALVKFCDADEIIDGILTSDIDVFVMPGGRASYYCEKLNGEGNRQIRNYVAQGGTYFGICGGAYYACDKTQWAKDQTDAICVSGELCFYQGSATGPVYDFIENGDTECSWDQAVSLTLSNGDIMTALYRAGPCFSEPLDEKTTVIARYTDIKGQPPAILNCSFGKGRAILTSTHIECCPALYEKMIYKHRNPSYEWQLDVLQKYKTGWSAKTDIFPKILDCA